MTTETKPDIERLLHLMGAATGDERHDLSAHSTLDLEWVLYDRVLRYDPRNPRSEERDRFVLSKGHGPLALYAILADKGFFPMEELSRFMSWESILGGHPDRNRVPGIEASTGSLGHGLPMAIGIALGLRIKRNDHRVFALIGDGECNEGTIWESLLLAGNLKLANLTVIAVNNRSSALDLGDLAAKFEAFGWSATTIDGRDHEQIEAALRRQDSRKPTAVVAMIEPRRGN